MILKQSGRNERAKGQASLALLVDYIAVKTFHSRVVIICKRHIKIPALVSKRIRDICLQANSINSVYIFSMD